MTISEIQQSPPLQQVEGRTEKKATGQASHGARQMQEDLVDLSSSVDGSSTAKLEKTQAQRVAALKIRVQEGSYQVDAKQLARKMLSSGSGI